MVWKHMLNYKKASYTRFLGNNKSQKCPKRFFICELSQHPLVLNLPIIVPGL